MRNWKFPRIPPKIPSSFTDRLSDARQFAKAHPRSSIGIAAALLVGLVTWMLVDTSDALNQEQVIAVRQFVLRTQSAAVREQFNQAVADGRLTVNETKSVIEAAKKSEPGYGLTSDQKITE